MRGIGSHGGDKPPARRRLPAAQRREMILAAAGEVFAGVGYRAARVSDVAARVGVTEPVIFQNFGSKAALFAAVVERAAEQAQALLGDLAGSASPPSGLIAHVLAASAHEPRAIGRAGHGTSCAAKGHAGAAYDVLFGDAITLTADPDLAGPVRNAVIAVAGHLADLIRHGQAGGSIRADIDADAAAWLLLSLLSAQRLRTAAMPASLEPAVTALALSLLTPDVVPQPPDGPADPDAVAPAQH